ncbi:MAG: LysM peptidoglycan-binding domain-containing protein [Chloroflexota bacterium]
MVKLPLRMKAFSRIFVILLLVSMLGAAPPPERPWGSRPLLSYFALTASLVEPMQRGAGLDTAQMQTVQRVARQEAYQLRQLLESTQVLVADPGLPLWAKRLGIWLVGYNSQVEAVIAQSDQALRQELAPPAYRRLVSWIEQRWPIEQALHGAAAPAAGARSANVFATRYDSGGAYRVALPDKCLKFSNGGNHICDDKGYAVNQGYTVILAYKKSVGVVVGESGPWNVDDNYWSGWADPQPRRMFSDLAIGMPEAQAAFFNGYNGGKDQFGRKVTAPFGIDLARQVSIDIGLQPGVNDWITISFMWTQGWDGSGAGGTPVAIASVEVATPNPDGSIIHEVKFGQTLWDIAMAYQVTLRTLYTLNNLDEKSVIIPGQKLILREAGAFTPAPTDTSDPGQPTATATITLQPTLSRAERTKTARAAITPSASPTLTPQVASLPALGSALPILGVGLAVLGLALLLIGRLINRRSD